MAWHQVKKVCSITLLIAAIVAGGALVYIQAGHAKLLSVQSGSMVPAINKGDLVIVKRIPDKLAVGDVITFINPHNAKQTITHRVVEAPRPSNGNLVTTKGDANPLPDQPIAPSQVLGSVQRSVPYAGRGFDLMRHPVGLLVLIYVPAFLIIADETRRLGAYYKTQQTYRMAGRKKKSNDEPGLPQQIATKGGPAVVLCIMACLAIAVPARAALNSKAQLQNNTITAMAASVRSDHVVIKKLVLRCSEQDTDTASTRPKIVLYNPTKQDVWIGGWQLRDNSGRFATIPGGTHLKARHTYEITPWLGKYWLHGLQYDGDAVTLQTNRGQVVDGLSWGSDASRLNPALQDVTAGTRLQRADPRADTDSADDWDMWQHECPRRHNDHDHGNHNHRDHFRHGHDRWHYERQEDEHEDDPAPDEPTQEGGCSFRGREPRWDD
jgi:signal peptidase I